MSLLDLSYDEYLDSEARAQSAHECAAETFISAVREELDVPLRMDSDSKVQWMPSDLLGECSNQNKRLLFAACSLALRRVRPDQASEHYMAIAEALRKFVNGVADEYADDNGNAFL
jgi:hypothetical protein